MPTPPTGHAVALGLGVETAELGVPTGTLISVDPILPASFGVGGAETEAQQIERHGFRRPGLATSKGGEECEYGHPLTAAHFLEPLQHLFGATIANGGVVKTTLAAGIFRYVLVPQGFETFRHLGVWGLLSKPPVQNLLAYGVKWGTCEIEVGDEGEVSMRLSGLQMHGTSLGPADPDAGNAGTYTAGPWVRGVVADPSAGPVYLKVTRDVVGGGVQFKVEQTAGVPAFAGAAHDVVYDASGQAAWQRLYGDDGLELGLDGENLDPLEVCWVGDETDHGDLEVDDVFEIPVTWSPPALTSITGAERFTLAHLVVRSRTIGAGAYEEHRGVRDTTLTLENPVAVSRGNGSKYPHAIDREGPLTAMVTFTRSFYDLVFHEKLDRHRRLDLVVAFVGRQLDAAGAYRESIEFALPYAQVAGAASPVSEVGRIEEEVELMAESDDGAAPFTVTVITTRDWTPAV